MRALVRTEWYRLLRDRSFWIMLVIAAGASAVMLGGGHQLQATGRDALGQIMPKSIVVMMVAGVYGGLFFGRDFEERTFCRPVASGASRWGVLVAKATIFVVAMDALIFAFPLGAVVFCAVSNGWGAPFDTAEALAFLAKTGALSLQGAALAMISVFAAACSRAAGPTIGIALGVTIAQIPLLNGPAGAQLSLALPFGTMCRVADGVLPAGLGALAGALWCVVLMGACLLVVRRAELR